MTIILKIEANIPLELAVKVIDVNREIVIPGAIDDRCILGSQV